MAMKYFYGAAALLAATVSAQDGQSCANAQFDGGNYYCSKVDAITYTNVGGSGSYNQVTNMDSSSGTCSSQPFAYSGSLSPLDGEVSLHMRGPFKLLQFAAYTQGGSSQKARRSEHARRHAHAHRHAHGIQERQAGDWVTATIDGQVQSWINDFAGGATAAPAAGTSAPAAASVVPDVASSAAAPLDSAVPSGGASSGSWTQQASYDASSQTKNGLVFLNHYGGTGSGVFDYTFGNSLSYASSDGTTGSSGPQTLAETTLPSSAEVVIMTDSKCGGENGDCGYYRPQTVAYHGFDGPSKAFLFEFTMPNDGQSTADIYDPVNMPSLWMLNAQIPRTLQYGQSDCSCWTSGCGEFDIMEVLTPGYDKAKSTMHGNIAGGSSYWFQRPENESIKLGVVMFNDNIHVKVLDSDTDFSSDADSVISEIVSSTMSDSNTVSLFSLAGAGSG